ncbi:MAG: ATP-binding protein [Chitinophagales bacterium]
MHIVTDEELNIEQLIQDAEQYIERRSPEGLPIAQKAMRLAEAEGNALHLAYSSYVLAFHYCLVENDYEKAIEICNSVLEKLDEDDISDVSYKIYMTLGNSYQLKGELFSAQEAYMKGLKHLESKTQLNDREKGFLASFYYNVSLLLSTTALNITSEEYLLKSIEIYSQLKQYFKLSKCYVAYAGVFEAKKDYLTAIDYLFKALELDTRTNDAYSLALTRANLGILHLRVKKMDEAFKYLGEALVYYEENKMAYETAMVKTNMGETLFENDKKEEGVRLLQEAEELFLQLDNKRELSNIYQLLGRVLGDLEDYKNAFNYQRKYTESLKFFYDVEKTNALTRAKKEFETEQKEKEATLLRLKNEEIRHYVVKLERSNNELKQFAHVASHDLREPLRMISSYMGLLKKSINGSITAQQEEFISFALDGAKRMEQLIVDLLRLAKVDANPRMEKVKIQSVVDEVKLNLEMLLKDKNALIISSDLPEIIADRTMMLQLFQNIIGNGIKYNQNAQPTVKVKCAYRASELEISISDNGIGIPEQFRERVFEIFKRLHTSQEYSGSGIGLAICRKIVETMNGKISIDENTQGGTVFRITFPITVIA